MGNNDLKDLTLGGNVVIENHSKRQSTMQLQADDRYERSHRSGVARRYRAIRLWWRLRTLRHKYATMESACLDRHPWQTAVG